MFAKTPKKWIDSRQTKTKCAPAPFYTYCRIYLTHENARFAIFVYLSVTYFAQATFHSLIGTPQKVLYFTDKLLCIPYHRLRGSIKQHVDILTRCSK